MRMEIYVWVLRNDLKSLFYLLFDVKSITTKSHNLVIQNFYSNTISNTTVTTDRDGHHDVPKRVQTEKRPIHLHSSHVENVNKFNGNMVSDAQKWKLDGCPRPFFGTRMGSKQMEAGSTRLYY